MSRPAIPKPSSLCSARCCKRFIATPCCAARTFRPSSRERRWNCKVRLEPLTLEEITRVWEALDGSYQLSVSYEVSVVNIMPEAEPERVTPVQIAMPEYGLIVSAGPT